MSVINNKTNYDTTIKNESENSEKAVSIAVARG